MNRPFLAFVPLLLLLPLLACGGPHFDGRTYDDDRVRYEVGTLSGDWRRLDVSRQNDLAWRSDDLDAIVQVNASCEPDGDAPLSSLTQHLLIGFTEREVVSQETLPFDGREALRSHVQAKLDGVPRELVLYVMKKDGCVYDLALIASRTENVPAATAAFDEFARAFRATSRGR